MLIQDNKLPHDGTLVCDLWDTLWKIFLGTEISWNNLEMWSKICLQVLSPYRVLVSFFRPQVETCLEELPGETESDWKHRHFVDKKAQAKTGLLFSPIGEKGLSESSSFLRLFRAYKEKQCSFTSFSLSSTYDEKKGFWGGKKSLLGPPPSQLLIIFPTEVEEGRVFFVARSLGTQKNFLKRTLCRAGKMWKDLGSTWMFCL